MPRMTQDPALSTTRSFDDDTSRWEAVSTRDAEGDGRFFYSVRTTGIYCKPSCSSRQPLRANVSFYETTAEAEKAGFRACKRCKPDQDASTPSRSADIAWRACRFIDAAETMPTLDELAANAGVSPFHFHRVFKAATGVTPRAYAVEQRAKRVREGLASAPAGSPGTSRAEADITSTYFDAGYGSSARFYSDAKAVLGMTPSRYRQGGQHETILFAIGRCSLGEILVASTDVGICAILLGDDAEALVRQLQDRFRQAEFVGGDAAFDARVAQVISFVDSPAIGLGLPLDVRGTAFQQRVWQALRDIPAGSTVSYSELAARLGHPSAVRAVASACAANTIAVAIPCHRVVRTDKSLSGYRWGVERKRALIDLERLQQVAP